MHILYYILYVAGRLGGRGQDGGGDGGGAHRGHHRDRGAAAGAGTCRCSEFQSLLWVIHGVRLLASDTHARTMCCIYTVI